MSNFLAIALHPKKKNPKLEEVSMIDNGPGKDFTVRFQDGDEFPEYMVEVFYPQKEEKDNGNL